MKTMRERGRYTETLYKATIRKKDIEAHVEGLEADTEQVA